MAGERIEIVVSAKDTASKILDRVADDAQELERLNPTVIVDAADRATDDLDKVIARTTALDGETARVILEAEAGKAEAELRALQSHLGQLDGEVATATLAAKDQASARLEKVQAQLRDLDGATADVTVDVHTRGLDKVEQITSALPGNIGAATGALRGMATGAAGVATGLGAAALAGGALADATADAALQAGTLADLTGATVEEASALAQIWQSTGADVKDLADVMLQTNGVLAQSPGLAKQLGIEGANVQERFVSAVEAARNLGTSIEDTAIKSQLFGEEGVRQVGALIGMYENVGDAVEEIEPPFSEEDRRQAVEYKRATTEMSAAVTQLGRDFGQMLVPALAEAARGLSDVLGALEDVHGQAESILEQLGVLGGLDEARRRQGEKRWSSSKRNGPRPRPNPPSCKQWRTTSAGSYRDTSSSPNPAACLPTRSTRRLPPRTG